MLAALRPLHWAKNLLIFGPLLLAHAIGDTAKLANAAICFAAFCLAASGTYLINDLRDAANDRLHPAKRERLIASGADYIIPNFLCWNELKEYLLV